MIALFSIAAAVAVLSTVAAITRANAVHALLYVIVSLLSVALLLFLLGAPLIAALEVIIYAGAIMVLFLFAIMLLGLGKQSVETERRWQSGPMWIGPAALAAVLAAELAYLLLASRPPAAVLGGGSPRQLGLSLFGPYLLAVEMASMLLVAGLVGTLHLGSRERGERRG